MSSRPGAARPAHKRPSTRALATRLRDGTAGPRSRLHIAWDAGGSLLAYPRLMMVQSELSSAGPHVTSGVRPESGGADRFAAPVATRWTAHDCSREESALAGAAVRVARSLAADLMGTGISFVLAGADGRELGRFAESAHELDTLDAAVPATAGHWSGTTPDEGDRPQHGRGAPVARTSARPEARLRGCSDPARG